MTEVSEPKSAKTSLWMRLFWVMVVALLMGAATTLVHILALLQLIVMATSQGAPNAEIQAFGLTLGAWQAKATRFQLGQSEERPWPWSKLD
ncbi:DUF4389 domain-containing protein [Rhodobacter sp. KR11]|uniref:DUF4389 domain-containing protein n=1 Tax=Rhodobacter sp. KR11 TaxID=2974588 RepID=UPI0022239AA8|nr:DUF4389 domain-containing protein [Rhodobacter sp. KR11]MCW1920083.1 DUF4389 domain-containing protein [Rhodobacter sp. KR11]